MMAKLILSFLPILLFLLLVAVPFLDMVAAVGSGGGGRGRGGSGRPFVQQTSPSIQQFFSEFNPNTPSPPPPHSPGGGRGGGGGGGQQLSPSVYLVRAEDLHPAFLPIGNYYMVPAGALHLTEFQPSDLH